MDAARSVLCIAPVYALQPRAALQRFDLGPCRQRDLWGSFNAGDQVPRHGLGEPRPAHQQMDMTGELREEHSGLAGRVSSSDDGDLLVAADLGLDRGRAVIDSGAFKLSKVRQIQLSVLDSGRHDDAAALNGPSVFQLDRVRRAGAPERAGGASDGDPGSELFRLNERAAGKILP